MTSIVPLAVLLSMCIAQQDALNFDSPRFGFSVRRPSDAWTTYASENQGGAKLVLSLYRRGSEGLPSVVVYVYDASEKTTPESAAASTQTKLEQAHATQLERGKRAVAGIDALTLHAQEASPLGSGEMAIDCVFFAQHGYLYAFQIARGLDDAPAEQEIASVLGSFALREPVRETESPQRAKWRELAKRCAVDLGWSADWKSAAERARREQKLVLVVYESYGPLAIPKTARSGVFMDPDFASLVRARFVPLELGADDDAPFRSAATYGLGKHSFGTAFLFVDADAHVVAESSFANASYLDEFARGLLPLRPSGDGPDSEESLERASAAFENGELERATKCLGRLNSAQAHRLRAAIARRNRDGERAASQILAGQRYRDVELEPEFAADQAVLDLRLDNLDRARTELAELIRRWPNHARACEAAFWLGACELASGEVAASTERWSRLIEAHAESPWAAKAAANLIGEGAFAGGAEKLAWPSRDLCASVAPSKRSPLAATEVERAERDARMWLVSHQREDGSWWNPMDGFSFDSALYTPAITSICAASLMPFVSDAEVRASVERALAWTLARHAAKAFEPGPSVAGVYSIWSRVYALELFVVARSAHLGDEARLGAAIDELAQSISKSQDPRGGWPYVTLPGDPNSAAFDPSASFLTAAVAFALIDAREAQVKIDESSLARALDFLAKLAQPDGTYRYMPDVPGEQIGGDRPEAAGRGPVCALALYLGQRADRAALSRALERFASHRPAFKAEWHKSLCHTAPSGFGAHYLAFDYLHAARAVRELDLAARAPFRAALLDDLLASRFEDGSFEDLPGLGRAYATAMALQTLRALGER